MLEDFFINISISAILTAVKNPKRAASLKKQLLKVRDAITAAFPNDPVTAQLGVPLAAGEKPAKAR